MIEQRKTYGPGHWSQAGPPRERLKQYLAGNRHPYNRTKVELISRGVGNDLAGKTVLDYGGGGGYMSVMLAERGASVTLVDAEPNALEIACLYARQRRVSNRIEFVQADRLTPEIRSRRFDLVLAKDVIEHIEEDEAFFEGLAQCQEPGDRLVISTQNRWSLNYLLEGTYWRRWLGRKDWCGWDPTHVRFYTPVMLGQRLRRAGYEPARWSSVFIVPYNILSWLVLLRKEIMLGGFRHLDLVLGDRFPFNRLGWNVIVFATRLGVAERC